MIDVVGMGADGPESCSESGRRVLAEADVIVGGRRHLELIHGLGDAERIEWPSPLRSGLRDLLQGCAGRRVAAVASGDPLVAGVGATLVEMLGVDAVRIHPAVSSVVLARARMGWPAEGVEVLRLGAGRNVDELRRLLSPGRRVLVLSADEQSPAQVAAVCGDAGVPDARLTVLGNLGAADECRIDTTATGLAVEGAADLPRLNTVAVECRGDAVRNRTVGGVHRDSFREGSESDSFSPASGSRPVAGWLAPGLPDDAFEHDGQLTKRHVRAAALAALQPVPGELLWDLGAGAGSVGIEWARLHRANLVVAVERDAARAQRIGRNAAWLGVPQVEVRTGAALDLLADLPDPDAIFVGGGASSELLAACWERLPEHGRLVVHGVTLETEALLMDRHAALGGELVRLAVSVAQPLGRYRGWIPARPVVQWTMRRSEFGNERVAAVLSTAPADAAAQVDG